MTHIILYDNATRKINNLYPIIYKNQKLIALFDYLYKNCKLKIRITQLKDRPRIIIPINVRLFVDEMIFQNNVTNFFDLNYETIITYILLIKQLTDIPNELHFIILKYLILYKSFPLLMN